MNTPLAYRMRPQTLSEIVGQTHLVGEKQILQRFIEAKQLPSIIFYGPPGTGKTTLASVLANELQLPYRQFNAVTGNKKELDAIFEEAKYYEGMVVIIDEVHRLNKDKQDLLLPHLENGRIILIGATTANPLHAINPAIRSRCHLFEVKSLTKADVKQALLHASISNQGLHQQYQISEDVFDLIANHANGDVRYALNLLELCAIASEDNTIHKDVIEKYMPYANQSMDKDGDGYYDVLSAFQKSIRGSDVNAALYYLSIMIEANDMDSIERRLLVIAYEDIGLANPAAVARTIQAIDTAKRVGFPEGRIPLSVATIDLSLSPKSKSAIQAIDAATQAMKEEPYQVPAYLRLTPTNMDPEEQYDYSSPQLWPYIQYLPNSQKDKQFYIANANSVYEKALLENYKKLTAYKRTNQLKKLKQSKK